VVAHHISIGTPERLFDASDIHSPKLGFLRRLRNTGKTVQKRSRHNSHDLDLILLVFEMN
jgi:hypothetical protein